MTVPSTTDRMPTYTGDGTTDTFAYTFRIDADADMLVVKTTIATGVAETLTLTTDYTVTGAGDAAGGTVVLVAGNLSSAYDLDLRRKVELTQPTDLRNQGSGYPGTVEAALDKAMHAAQQQQDELDRSLKLSENDGDGSVSTVLPSVATATGGDVVALKSDKSGYEHVSVGSVALATPGDGTATNAKLADMAQGTTKLRARGAGTGDPVDGTALQLRQNAFDNAAGEAETSHVKDLAVTNAKVANDALTQSKRIEDWSIYGLKMNVNSSDNDAIDIAVGSCRSADDADRIALTSSLTKQIDATWAVGTAAGGLDTGTVSNNAIYAVWLIKRSDTGVVDALFSTSFTAPTMPTDYDTNRRIGAVWYENGKFSPFVHTGNRITLTSDHPDFGLGVTHNTLASQTFGLPHALLAGMARVSNTTATGGDLLEVYIARSEASAVAADWLVAAAIAQGGGVTDQALAQFEIHCDSSGQFKWAAGEPSGTSTLRLKYLGWTDLALQDGD